MTSTVIRNAFSGTVDSEGGFQIKKIPPGTWLLYAESDLYQGTFLPGVPCPSYRATGVCPSEDLTAFEVDTTTTIEGIEIALPPGGAIAGTIRDESSEQLIFGTGRVFDSTGQPIASFSGSEFESFGIPVGDYYVAAGTNWHEPELYPDVPCPDFSCDLTQGELISVVDGEVTRGIEFTLDKTEPCYADYRLLCLGNDERFDVRAHWVDDTGEDQQAADVHLTRDSGFFWFFDDDNIEMVVKVLDGGSIGDGAFWVFAAGLTNVGVELTVEDTWTGAERTYINPLGTTYQPILDVHAFATCDATKSAAPAASEGDEGDEGPVERSQVAAAHAPGTITTSEKCAPGTLCLQDRFEVHAEFGGAQGPEDAVPVQLTPDSGYFWFFGADNVELVVKLLDACVDPFDRFWFFAAGLTDVDVRLRVRDTWTGAERLYENSQGTPFAPVLDVDAFATCDAQADLASVAEPKDVEVGSDANAPFLQP